MRTIVSSYRIHCKKKKKKNQFLKSTIFEDKRRILEKSYSELLAKLQSSREEILKSSGEEAYSNLQRLLDNLKHYQFESSTEFNAYDETNLQSQIEREELILGDFHKLFAAASGNFYPNFKVENLPAINFAFCILDCIALNEPDRHILLYNLLNDKIIMEGLNWYTSSQVIINRGYIEIFKTNDIQEHLRDHQDLGSIRNILNSSSFFLLPIYEDNWHSKTRGN
ncbi:hypothetical protein BY996DRAFT_2258182 [Phakopsora pachyrhizi]|nr:hypothetical protein BY996DRAFT_2258182 [Phakopsora pachyrhizi]